MKGLKEVLLETIESFDLPMNDEIAEVIDFIKTNYRGDATEARLSVFGPKRISGFYIRPEKNDDGKYVVDFKGFMCVKNLQITSLTNDLFVFGEGKMGKLDASFDCSKCKNLTSLEGAPKRVSRSFSCDRCENLTSLEGAPIEVGYDFICFGCTSLKSLKGAPKKVTVSFQCQSCGVQFTEDDIKKVSKVRNEEYYV